LAKTSGSTAFANTEKIEKENQPNSCSKPAFVQIAMIVSEAIELKWRQSR